MNITRTNPTVEPVSLAMAKAQLQISHNADNVFIERIIRDSRIEFEQKTSRALTTITLTVEFNENEVDNVITVPVRPFTALTSLKYYDSVGTKVLMVLDTDYYLSGTNPMQIVSLQSQFVAQRTIKSFEVIGTAGYGDPEDVPADIRDCILRLVADKFNNPESVKEGFSASTEELDISAQNTINRYQTFNLF